MPAQQPVWVNIWPPSIRFLHWSLAIGFLACYLTRHSPGRWHEWLGYAVLVIVIARILLGFKGPAKARFSDFVQWPSNTWAYCRSLKAGTEPRYLGHNPLGGYMMIALLLANLLICISGWLFTTDSFWGVEWVANLHSISTYVCILLILTHLIGVLITSIRKRENLVGAMLHGRKRAPKPGDIA